MSQEGGGRECRRRGASLAELLVALTILAIGGTLTTRLLVLATRELESAELGLRAVLFMGELHEGRTPMDLEGGGGWPAARPAGPGLLVPEIAATGELRVRYEPPLVGDDGAPEPGGPGGYLRPVSWALEGDT